MIDGCLVFSPRVVVVTYFHPILPWTHGTQRVVSAARFGRCATAICCQNWQCQRFAELTGWTARRFRRCSDQTRSQISNSETAEIMRHIYMEPVWTWRHFGNSMQQLIGIIGIIGSYGAFDDNFEVMAVIFVVSILLESALTLDVWRSSSRRP